MPSEPNIFIKHQAVRDAHHPTQGNGHTFKTSVEALINGGNVVAVGENSIERVFDTAADFGAWFDSMKPATDSGDTPPLPFA